MAEKDAEDPDFRLVRQAVLSARMSEFEVRDKICVRNLEVTVNAGMDVWGRRKKQRALITITLNLSQSFDSAAESDALDRSTVHYGKLSKDIQRRLDSISVWQDTSGLAWIIRHQIEQTKGDTKLLGADIDITYPKGSMLGDSAGYSTSFLEAREDQVLHSSSLYLRNVRVPCLIGVNSNERMAKQPVVINLWIECVMSNRSDDYPKLEAVVVNAVADSSFETLESLSAMVVRELRDKFFTAPQDDCSYIRLRVEKPLAVPFADAPCIEILRPVKG